MDLVALDHRSKDHPLSVMIADLIRQNVEQNTTKSGALSALHLTALIVATDIESAVRLQFRGADGLLVHDGHHDFDESGPTVTIRAVSDTILELARLSLIGGSGVPVLWDATGFSVLKQFLAGELTIRPLLRHIGRLTRLLRVISVAE